MQRKTMPAIVSVIASILLLTSLCLLFYLRPANASAITPNIIAQFSSPVATTTSSAPTTTQLDSLMRRAIAESLGILANDEESVRVMATLLQTSDIADSIHHALWTASHRAGVRVYIIDGAQKEKQVEIVKL